MRSIGLKLQSAEEFLLQHPILSISPVDLARSGILVSDYTEEECENDVRQWTTEEVELWKEYYDI